MLQFTWQSALLSASRETATPGSGGHLSVIHRTVRYAPPPESIQLPPSLTTNRRPSVVAPADFAPAQISAPNLPRATRLGSFRFRSLRNFRSSRGTQIDRLFVRLSWQKRLPDRLYTGRTDVTESTVTLRSPFCGYNTMQCVLLNGEDLSCYSNEMESISFRKCPHDHRLTSKAYLSAVAVSDIYRSFYLQDGGKNQLRRCGTKLRHCRPTRFACSASGRT